MTPHDKSLTDEEPSLTRKTEKRKKRVKQKQKRKLHPDDLRARIDWEDKQRRKQYGR